MVFMHMFLKKEAGSCTWLIKKELKYKLYFTNLSTVNRIVSVFTVTLVYITALTPFIITFLKFIFHGYRVFCIFYEE